MNRLTFSSVIGQEKYLLPNISDLETQLPDEEPDRPALQETADAGTNNLEPLAAPDAEAQEGFPVVRLAAAAGVIVLLAAVAMALSRRVARKRR